MEFEIVKVVNGHEIKRYAGTRKPYFVNIEEENGVGYQEFHSFNTKKEAVKFLEEITAKTEPETKAEEPVPTQRTIMCDDNIHKWVITNEENVEFFELMGDRWVRLGNPENWSKELIDEEFGAETTAEPEAEVTETATETEVTEIKILLPVSTDNISEGDEITLMTKKTRTETKVNVCWYDKKSKILCGWYMNKFKELSIKQFDMRKYDLYL